MGSAWIDAYWLSYSLAGTPRISFTAGISTNPWINITDTIRFEIIKTQLARKWVWILWNDTTKEVTRIVTYQPKQSP
jgi:hypothetical protein